MDPIDEDDTMELPDDERVFLEEMGMGGDGSPMTLADDAWTGMPWEPDSEAGVW